MRRLCLLLCLLPIPLVLTSPLPAQARETVGQAAAETESPLMGKRFFTLNAIVRVNQIEVSRETTHGVDESAIHSVKEARIFREAIAEAWPGARITWAFSWRALNDPRQRYIDLRQQIVAYHHHYRDEITFIPGGYFANMYNSREQVNRDLHDGLALVSRMVGRGYRPKAVIAGFLAADNLRYLAEEEGIHVCQGTIFSQYAVDNGDGEGSVAYPYYPSTEHFCKPAQGEKDRIDCVNLDGWSVDFLAARIPGARMVDGEKHRSRMGVGPIETVIWLGTEQGTKQMLHTTGVHFDQGFKDNGFAWVNCGWELSLVEARQLFPSYRGRNGMEGLRIWLTETRKRWPDTQFVTLGEFGLAWREHYRANDFDYRFHQRGSGIRGSIAEMEIEWRMNKDFRLARQRNWKEQGEWEIIDFTRYDLPAKEPADPVGGKPSRNWSMMNVLNQKGVRPQDRPMAIEDLAAEHQALIRHRYPKWGKD